MVDAPATEAPEAEVNFDNLTPQDIEALRAELVVKSNGNWKNLSTEDLHVLAMLTMAMRRRSAKPPKQPKDKSAKPKANLQDILGQF